MKKRIIISVLTFLVLAGIGLFVYINKVFLPVKLKEIIETRSEEFLDRKVSFGKIDYHFFQGLIIENLTIYQKEDPSSPFVHFDQARLNVLITPILSEKKIIIPSLIIMRPYVHVIHQDPTTWNFSDLLSKRRPTAAKSRFNVFLGGITIEGGQLELTDKATEAGTAVNEKFENINLKANLSVKSGIKFQAGIQGPANAALAASGEFDLVHRGLDAQINIQKFDPFKYVKMFTTTPKFIHRTGTIDAADLKIKINDTNIEARGNISLANADVTIQTTRTIQLQGSTITATDLKLSRKNNVTQITADLIMKDGNVTLDNDKSFAGNVTAPDLEVLLDEKRTDLKGRVDIQNARFVLGPDRVITGDLSSKRLTFKRKETVFTVQGDLLAPNANVHWNPSQDLKGNFSSSQIAVKSTDGAIEANGSFDVQDADFVIGKTAIKGNLKAGEITLTFNPDKDLNIKTAFLLENSQINLYGDKKISGTIQAEDTSISLANEKLTAAGLFQIKDGYLSLPQEREFRGNPTIEFNVARALNSEAPSLYSGSMTVENGTLKGLPKVGTVEQVNGTISFANDKIKSESLQLRALDTDISLAGSLQDFQTPQVNVEAAMSNVNMDKIRPYFTELLAKYKVSPAGRADLKIHYQGVIDDPKQAQISFSANLKQATLTGEKLPAPITHISGKVNYSKENIAWQNLTGTYQEKNYTLNGQWNQPFIETTVDGPQVNLAAKVQLKDELYKILSLKGTYFASDFDLKGNINLSEGAPDLSLSGRIEAELKNLGTMTPKLKKTIEDLKLQGKVSLEGSFQGDPHQWEKGNLILNGNCPLLLLSGHKFENVDIKINQDMMMATHIDITSDLYQGQFLLSTQIQTQREGMPMVLSAKINDSDLAELKNHIKLKDIELGGKLLFEMDLDGPLVHPEKIKGRGSFNIKDARIGKYNLTKGIWRILLGESYENLIFTMARGNFYVKKKYIVSEDLFLSNDTLNLNVTGWISFDQKINLVVTPDKDSSLISKDIITKTPAAIMDQAVKYVGIKITGSLKDPHYKKFVRAERILKDSGGTIFDGMQGILEGIGDILQ